MSKILTKDEVDKLVKNQLYRMNCETSTLLQMVTNAPVKLAINTAIHTGIGSTITFGSSLFCFRKFGIAAKDVKAAFPVLATYSLIDFGINYPITKAMHQRYPSPMTSVISSTAAGASCGFIFSAQGQRKYPIIFGGVFGAIYGYARNVPSRIYGFDLF